MPLPLLTDMVDLPDSCDECGAFIAPNGGGHSKYCQNYLGIVIPSHVDHYASLGMLGFYKYRVSASEDFRRKRLLKLYREKLMHSGKNKNYVESFGDPSSRTRMLRIDEIIAGLNEFSAGGPEAVSKRKSDIAWLWNIHNSE